MSKPVGTPKVSGSGPAAPAATGGPARTGKVNQVVTDAYGCAGNLNDLAGIEAAIRAGCAAVGAAIVTVTAHRYEPQGATIFALLKESHVTVTTWPEHHYAIVDVFLCNASMDPGIVWKALKAYLAPKLTRTGKLAHAVGHHPALTRPQKPKA